jgi:hypothetical protein
MNLDAYRRLLAEPQTRRFLAGLGVSALGDGLSTVTIAWLAVVTAPAGDSGVFVGVAVAAYTLPGVIGAIALRRYVAARPAREMVLGHAALRGACLGLIAVLSIAGALPPYLYVALLAGSSLLYAWGNAGQYTLLSALAGPDGRLASTRSPAPRSRSRRSSDQWPPASCSGSSVRASSSRWMLPHSRSWAWQRGASGPPPLRRSRRSTPAPLGQGSDCCGVVTC